MPVSRSQTTLTALILYGALALPPAAAEESESSATPYRPTVSNPAALSLPGYLEIELGALNVRGGEAHVRNSLPLLFKYAFTEDFGLLVGGEPYVSLTNHDEDKLSGAGNTTLQLKFRHALDDDSALGLEAGVQADTAKSGIGSGKTDYLLNAIYSREIGDTVLDVNLGYTHFGVTGEDEIPHGMSWAAAVAHPLVGNWGIAFELSGALRRHERGASQFLSALSYNVSRQVVLDAGVAFGLSKTAPDWALMTGITVLFK